MTVAKPIIDIVGQRFERLEVVEYVPSKGWLCRCDCGNTLVSRSNALRSGRTRSCGCLAREQSVRVGVARLIDLTGQRFGRLTVTERADNQGARTMWLCRCDCGTKRVINGASLRRGLTKSCGCLRRNDHEHITYEAAHIRIRTAKGLAADQRCVDCGGQAADWSYIGGDPDELTCERRGLIYSLDGDRYVARCKPCHKRRDMRLRRAGRPNGSQEER